MVWMNEGPVVPASLTQVLGSANFVSLFAPAGLRQSRYVQLLPESAGVIPGVPHNAAVVNAVLLFGAQVVSIQLPAEPGPAEQVVESTGVATGDGAIGFLGQE